MFLTHDARPSAPQLIFLTKAYRFLSQFLTVIDGSGNAWRFSPIVLGPECTGVSSLPRWQRQRLLMRPTNDAWSSPKDVHFFSTNGQSTENLFLSAFRPVRPDHCPTEGLFSGFDCPGNTARHNGIIIFICQKTEGRARQAWRKPVVLQRCRKAKAGTCCNGHNFG